MSSRIAACGQPPVSTARMRSGESASLRMRNSASSRVKMSLVTTPSEWLLAQRAAEREHQRRLAAAHRPADAHRERALRVVAVQRLVALVKQAGVQPVLVGVAVLAVVGVLTVVVMGVANHRVLRSSDSGTGASRAGRADLARSSTSGASDARHPRSSRPCAASAALELGVQLEQDLLRAQRPHDAQPHGRGERAAHARRRETLVARRRARRRRASALRPCATATWPKGSASRRRNRVVIKRRLGREHECLALRAARAVRDVLAQEDIRRPIGGEGLVRVRVVEEGQSAVRGIPAELTEPKRELLLTAQAAELPQRLQAQRVGEAPRRKRGVGELEESVNPLE